VGPALFFPLGYQVATSRTTSHRTVDHRPLKRVAAFGDERSSLARYRTNLDGPFSAASLAEAEAISVFIRVWPQEP